MDEDTDPMDPLSVQVVKATAGPLTEGGQNLLARAFGGAADVFGAYFKDRAVIWRAGRGIYTVERAAEMLRAAGLEPGPVKTKALLSIMEGATLEDDEDLSEMWAALLANASIEDLRGTESTFAAILRQLSPTDALVLRAAYARARLETPGYPRPLSLQVQIYLGKDGVGLESAASALYPKSEAEELRRLAEVPPAALGVSADNLVRLGLLIDMSTTRVKRRDGSGSEVQDPYVLARLGATAAPAAGTPRPATDLDVPAQTRALVVLSNLGTAFTQACEPPGTTGPLPSEPAADNA